METENLKYVSSKCIQDEGASFVDYQREFREKSFLSKLWIIFKSLPSYFYFTYFASENDKFQYRALRNYLNKKIEN